MKVLLSAFLLSLFGMPLIGMEQEEFKLTHGGQTYLWKRGTVDPKITEIEIQEFANEYLKVTEDKKDNIVRQNVLNYYMTPKEKNIWQSVSVNDKKCMELEAWSRFKIAYKEGRFGNEEDTAKVNYQEYIEDNKNVKGLQYPNFRVEDEDKNEEPIAITDSKSKESKEDEKLIMLAPSKSGDSVEIFKSSSQSSEPAVQENKSEEKSQKDVPTTSASGLNAWKTWAWKNVTPRNVALVTIGGITIVGGIYAHKKLTKKDIENAAKTFSKR